MAARPTLREHLEALKRQFPGREAAIDLLGAELGRPGMPGTACLVHGPPATGKTAVIRGLLATLRLRHAYFNCNEATRPRALLAALLAQLKGGKRRRDEAYECGIACDGLADFRLQLPGVVARRGPCWLVLDNAQRLAGSELLAALLRAREDTGAEVGVLLVASGGGWASGRYVRDTAAVPPPRELHFASYSPVQLQTILELRHEAAHGAADLPTFRQFLAALVPPFCRATNNLADLQAACDQLFPRYVQPLRDGTQAQPKTLYARVREEVQQRIRAMQLQQPGGAQALVPQANEGGDGACAPRHVSSRGLSFELPYVSKLLLLAAHVASRNKPTADRAVFDPTHKARGRKNAHAHDRRVEAAVEARLRGPHSFPLERLLHVFYVLYVHHDGEEGEEGEAGLPEACEARRVMQQAEVLQQVSSLVALRLLEHCGGDVLEGQLYRCNVTEATTQTLAGNLRLRLSEYLRLG